MESLLKPNSLVLVTIMPLPRDLEYARILGWYRIPLRTAPKIISVDYLAFYQPSSFGDRKWLIEAIAPVRGNELVTRYELIRDENHPKAREEYYKIQLGPLVTLPKPIKAVKWKRITFFYTTGQYLLEAETVNDLIVHTQERKLLWQSLRERADEEKNYQIPDVEVHPDIIEKILGLKDLMEKYGDHK